MLKGIIINHFPFLGKIVRFLTALKDTISVEKETYSQYKKEDITALSLLSNYNLSEGIYIDIGANQPTKISNTYKFYRKGLHGILIEPNTELARLNKIFRPKDIVLPYGCGNKSILAKFYISKTPILSSFERLEVNQLWKVKYIPIFRLEDLIVNFEVNWIFFLSIDVEGLNLEVLTGSEKILAKVCIVCIEFDEKQMLNIFEYLSSVNFEHILTTGCNYIFRNKNIEQFNRYKVCE